MISMELLKKWKRMVKKESVFHVDQPEGAFYSVSNLNGYYNDLRNKVRNTVSLDEYGIPYNIATRGKEKKQIYFPITIFQYGLGAYDLWIETDDPIYKEKALAAADWAVAHQKRTGEWDAFGCLEYNCKISSMAQGEASSLLARAYKETGDKKYLNACTQAVDFMLLPRDQGGTSEYTSDGLELWEYPDKSLVLNGWVFSAFGLLDCWKITKNEKYLKLWEESLNAMKKKIREFDSGHWSLYDLEGKYASPFYHKLHIELLKAVEELCPSEEWEEYINKWSGVMKSQLWSKVAFIIKVKQKLGEKKSQEWVLTG